LNSLTERFFHAPTGVFTQPEVAVAMAGSAFSRHGLVKRAMSGGEILNLRRGLYCLAPRYQKRPVSVYALAQRIHGPSYLSMETALSHHGWIPEAVYACTCASYRNAKEFSTPLGVFSYSRVPQKVFYAGVERCVDPDGNAYFMASPAKALADYVYVRRPPWKNVRDASQSLRIEEEDILAVSSDEITLLEGNCTVQRVKRFLASWKEALNP
jgi:hypothetical protein